MIYPLKETLDEGEILSATGLPPAPRLKTGMLAAPTACVNRPILNFGLAKNSKSKT